jgi:hypothetical protein
MKTWVFPFRMPVIRNVKKFLMIGMYHIYVYSEYIRINTNQFEFAVIDNLYFGCIEIAHIRESQYASTPNIGPNKIPNIF